MNHGEILVTVKKNIDVMQIWRERSDWESRGKFWTQMFKENRKRKKVEKRSRELAMQKPRGKTCIQIYQYRGREITWVMSAYSLEQVKK